MGNGHDREALKPEGDEFDETAIKFEFIKARLRTPATADQFKPMIIYPDNLRFEEVGKGGAPSDQIVIAHCFLLSIHSGYASLARGCIAKGGRG
jgi:hypothetical protein